MLVPLVLSSRKLHKTHPTVLQALYTSFYLFKMVLFPVYLHPHESLGLFEMSDGIFFGEIHFSKIFVNIYT